MTLVKFTNGQKYGALTSPFSNVLGSVIHQQPYFPKSVMSRIPSVNIAEKESEFLIEIAAPGLKKEDFRIAVEKDELTVKVDKIEERGEEPALKSYTRKEFNYNSFSRSFTLPESADQANIRAEYTDGILSLKICKKEEAIMQVREISVK